MTDEESPFTPLSAVPRWMWPAGALLLGYALFALFTTDAQRPLPLEAAAMAIRFVFEASGYLWAAQRADLPPRLRLSLRIFGGTSLFSLGALGLMVSSAMGWVSGVDGLITAAGLTSYCLSTVSLLVYPRAPLRPQQGRTVALDLVLVMGALLSVQWVVIKRGAANPADYDIWLLVYGLAQVALMSGLSVVINLGLTVPSPGAFWRFMAAVAAYLPVTFFGQIHALTMQEWSLSLSRLFYFAGVLMGLGAAVRFRTDPLEVHHRSAAPEWLLGLNPLTLAMPLMVGATLITSVLQHRTQEIIPLATTLIAVALLLGVRLVLTARENVLLIRDEQHATERLLQVRNDERSRLMADMHDGFGAQLVSARIRTERGELTQAQLTELVNECLGDLQLVIDSMKVQDDSLSSALGAYRARLNRRLAGHTCTVHWELDFQGSARTSARVMLQVLRVVQEAINNVLKHAHASNAWVEARIHPDGPLQVRVSDDGVGLVLPLQQGRGMDTMEGRARVLRGTLEVGPRRQGGTGTTVSLVVPREMLSLE